MEVADFLVVQSFDPSTKQFRCNDPLLESFAVNDELVIIRLQVKMITDELVEHLLQILVKKNVKSIILRLHGIGQMKTGFQEGEIYACTLDEEEIDLLEPLEIYGKRGYNKLSFTSDCHAIWCVGAEVTEHMKATFHTIKGSKFTDTTQYFLQELTVNRSEPTVQR